MTHCKEEQVSQDNIYYRLIPMGDFNEIPCPQEDLDIAVRNMMDSENEDVPKISNSEVQISQAAVGVASYNGKTPISPTDLISLVVLKYILARNHAQPDLN